MAPRTLYDLLGLDIKGNSQDIKLAYRLAKVYHPDKNNSPEATSLFQELNQAYHTPTNEKLRAEYDIFTGISEPHSDTSHGDSSCIKSLPNVAINIRENMMSVTIDITDITFLAFVQQCEQYYDMQPIDRGHHGLQFKFEYRTPHEPESYGSISLTFYASTARLHVQGSSYLLWVEEHLPCIYADTDREFTTHTSKWAFLTRQRGIGRKREHRPLCDTARADPSPTTDTLPVCKSAVPPITTAFVSTPVVFTPTVTASPCTYTSVVSAGLAAVPFAPAVPAGPVAALSEPAVPAGPVAAFSEPTVPAGTVAALSAPAVPAGPRTASSAPVVSAGHVAASIASHVSSDETDATHTETVSVSTTAVSHAPVSSPCPAAVTDTSSVSQTSRPATRQAVKVDITTSSNTKTRKEKKEKRPTRTSTRKVKNIAPVRSTVNVEPCQPGCNVTVKEASDMIRCSLCMAWHHNVCVGEDRLYVGVWTCVSCRRLPTLVLSLQTQVNDLASLLSVYQENDSAQREVINRLKSENNKLSQKVSNLEKTNTELSKLIQTMSDVSPPSIVERPTGDPPPCISISVPTSNRFAALSQLPSDNIPRNMSQRLQGKRVRFAEIPRQIVPPVSVSVIGSSIVRGVAPLLDWSKEYCAGGFVFPGRTAKQINGSLKHIPTSDISVVFAGSNDIETQSVKDCVNEIRKVVDNISRKRQGKTVIMCQIPHRYDKPQLNNKIDDVNTRVAEEIKKYKNVHILTHTVVRADFKKDLLHFNERGVAKFALQIRHVIRKLNSSK